MNKSGDGQVMTVGEVADFLRISPSQVYRLLAKEKIPARRIGRQWRIWRPALETYMAATAADTPGAARQGTEALSVDG